MQAAAKAAEAAQKKIQAAFDSSEEGYERQIALINTEVDKRKNASEVAKLQFEIDSGKLVGINTLQQERLKGLAEELDRLQKLKLANEDAAKSAAYAATLKSANETVSSGFGRELAGAGSGDKARDRLQQDLQVQQDFNQQMAELQQYNSGDISKELYDTETQMLSEALAERMVIQQDYYNQLDDAQSNWLAWAIPATACAALASTRKLLRFRDKSCTAWNAGLLWFLEKSNTPRNAERPFLIWLQSCRSPIAIYKNI